MRLIDGHAHLEDVPNIDAELARARSNGLVAVIAVGSDEKSNETVLKISRRHAKFVFPALGLHPWALRADLEKMVNSIETNIKECVAIGEVGLDFKYQTPKELQTKAFNRVLGLGVRYDKPVIIHSRWAWREALEMVRDAGVKRAIFHWYSGPTDILREVLAIGCYVSATPAAEFSELHRQALMEVPLDRLLLETDAPVKYHRIASTPSDVLKTVKAVAQLKGTSELEIAEATTENAIKFFDLEI